MNFDQLKVYSAQGRMRHEPGVGFTLDGALVTDEADHAICNRLLGLAEPFVVPSSLVTLPDDGAPLVSFSTEHVIVADAPPDIDAPVEPRAVDVAPEPEAPPSDAPVVEVPPVADEAPAIPTPEPEED